MLPEYQDRAVELLADILRPALREDDFHTEKQVILEEIQMYEDQPPFGADDKCRALYYGSHPLGRSVLGTAESIGAFDGRGDARLFPPALQPGQYRAGRRRPRRLRRAWWPPPSGAAAIGSR